MTEPQSPDDERAGHGALRRLGLLDSGSEERFDRINRLAQRILGVPVALETREPCSPGTTPNIATCAGCPIAAPDGSLVGRLCVIDRRPGDLSAQDLDTLRDLAALVEHEIASSHRAVDDELTGLQNRRGFFLVANEALALCRRKHEPALVLYADVNGLKAANDDHGHECGDRLITAAAEALASTFRDADVVARIGGDEFVAFLSGYGAEPAVATDRLETTVRRMNRRFADAPFRLSLAVGYAYSAPWGTESLDELVQRADMAMYEAKRADHASPAR